MIHNGHFIYGLIEGMANRRIELEKNELAKSIGGPYSKGATFFETTKVTVTWDCDYCGTKQKMTDIHCVNCGAPYEDKYATRDGTKQNVFIYS